MTDAFELSVDGIQTRCDSQHGKYCAGCRELALIDQVETLTAEVELLKSSCLTVDQFRAKVLVILSESQHHPLAVGHAARRITEIYVDQVKSAGRGPARA